MDISYRKELFHTIPNQSPKVHVLIFVCWKNCVLFGIVRWSNGVILFYFTSSKPFVSRVRKIKGVWFKILKEKNS
jgi:hypothetical protein